MPTKQQHDTRLDQQLEEAAFLHEDDHAVEGQHHPEEVDHPFVAGHVVEVQQVVRRERQQRRRECDPSVGHEAAEREICEDCGDDEELQHEDSGGVKSSGWALSEGQGGQLHTCVAADREAGVRSVLDSPVVVYEPSLEPLEAVFGGEVHGYCQVLRGNPVVIARRSVEVPSVTAKDEDRRERDQQQGEGKQRRPQRGLKSVEGDHVSETCMREGETHIGALYSIDCKRDAQQRDRSIYRASLERVWRNFDFPDAAVAVELSGGDSRNAVLWKVDAHQTLAVE